MYLTIIKLRAVRGLFDTFGRKNLAVEMISIGKRKTNEVLHRVRKENNKKDVRK